MISQEIRKLVKEWDMKPIDINKGLCDTFALEVIKRMGGYSSEITDQATDFDTDLPGHFWLEYKGRCYDAECPQGVNNWLELPMFARVIVRG